MRSKLGYLTGISLKRKVKTKWFVIANVLLAILMIGLFNVDHVIQFFGGDFSEKTKVYVIDQTNTSYDIFQSVLEETSVNFFNEDQFEVSKYDKTLKEAEEEAKKDAKIVVLLLEYDEEHSLKASIISKGTIETLSYQALTGSIQNTKVALAMMESSIDVEELARINRNAIIERTILDEQHAGEEEGAQMIMSVVFPFIVLPVFMLTMFLVQMIGAEVNDEKATRGMEIIISNVSPTTHFFSKVLAGNLFVLLQGGLLLCYAGLSFLIKRLLGGTHIVGGVEETVSSMIHQIVSSGMGKSFLYILPLSILLLIVTFIGYSLLAGILASMTTNTEDFQQLQSPIMVISMAGYMLSIMAGLFQGSVFIRICSYIPFISAILSPSILVLGHIGIFDIIISILLMCGVDYLLIKYGLRIYKVGILNYSSKDLWKKMFQSLKKGS